MATFKVGQRVRIVSECMWHGREATIWSIAYNIVRSTKSGSDGPHPVLYRLDVDGQGRVGILGKNIAKRPDEIAPITDPRADEFIADMNRFAHISKTKVTQ